MTWETISTIEARKDWQFTPITASNLFRLKHQVLGNEPLDLAGDICLGTFDPNGDVELWIPQPIFPKPWLDVIEIIPPYLADWRVGIKLKDGSFESTTQRFYFSWLIRIDDFMPLSNPGQFSAAPSTSGQETTVTASETEVTILAANALRKGATFWNKSTSNLYLSLGATVSTSSFTATILPSGYYEIPYSYNGIVTGIWDAAVGSVNITELT